MFVPDASSPAWSERVDGGPVRLRRNGRSARACGLYFSVKSGRHLPYESHLERHALWCAEVDVEVVRSWVQPFTMTYADGNRLRRYTPDRKDLRADGRLEVIEIKDDAGRVASVTAAAIVQELAPRGMSYRVIDRAQIEAEPTFGAVRAVQRHRRTALDAVDAVRTRAALASGPLALAVNR